jgi:hypothetical protein
LRVLDIGVEEGNPGVVHLPCEFNGQIVKEAVVTIEEPDHVSSVTEDLASDLTAD